MISFDIFDTLLTRRVANPYGIFALMQKALAGETFQAIPAYIRENFYTLRIHAEELARHDAACRGREEIVLADIYEAMGLAAQLNAEQKETLCRLECDTELANILPIRQNLTLLQNMLEQDRHVVLISDMYLPQETICAMLQKVSPDLCRLPLYLSSQLGVRKTTGNIYRKVKEAEAAEYSAWIHYGDNPYQDREIPESLGIECRLVGREEPLPIERRVLSLYGDHAGAQLMSGIARYTRICEGRQQPAGRMGSAVCGPILFSYVDWLLRDCVEQGVTRLYFIARDGYLLKKIADIVIAKRKLPIQTKYIYGSRKAWRLCSLSEEHFNLVEILSWSYYAKAHTVEQFAGLLELTAQELIPFLPYGAQRADASVNQVSGYRMAVRLEKDPAFRRFYLNRQSEKRALAAAYLQQEIDVSDEHFMFVDVSGGGLTQGCLAQLLRTFSRFPVQTYFFKLDRVNLVLDCTYKVFFPSMLENNLVIEMLCHAPHGQTCGYRREGDRIVPVLDGFEQEAFARHGFAQLEQALCTYAELMAEAADVPESILAVVKEYLVYVAHTPDEEVLTYFASFPNNETGREKKLTEYAPKLGEEDILNIFLRRMPWEDIRDYYRGTDLNYSMLRCGVKERALAEKCRREYDSEWGRAERADKLAAQQAAAERYGAAAYFPCELLERRIVLYGAGKYGRKLYERLCDEKRLELVKWVDRKQTYQAEDYPEQVESVDALKTADFDQLVIGVADPALAASIRSELIAAGIPENKLFWAARIGCPRPFLGWEDEYRKESAGR